MKKIKCHACTGTPKGTGCGLCGGYKVLLFESQCCSCKKKCWQRPGVHTIYVGKTFSSWDGLKFVVTSFKEDGTVCAACADKLEAK